MKYTDTHDYAAGGRVSTPKFRQTLQSEFEPEGLAESHSRNELLCLVKRVGRGFGFTPSMVRLLEHYMLLTRECDWQTGACPIVFKSVTRTAEDLDLSERQVQNLEYALFKIGVLTWNDSGNHRRYGARDEETGELVFAFGVVLTPLASLKSAMEIRLAEIEQEKRGKATARQQLTYYRRQLRAVLAEAQGRVGLSSHMADWSADFETLKARCIRAGHSLGDITSLVARHKVLFDVVSEALAGYGILSLFNKMSRKTSSRDALNFIPYKITTNKQTDKSVPSNPPADSGFQESVPQQAEPSGNNVDTADSESQSAPINTGLEHIRLEHVIDAASERFLIHLTMQRPSDTWDGVIAAADSLRDQLGIHRSAWRDACTVLGRVGAAVCLLLTDHAAQRETNRVYSPGGYFRSMIKKARQDELRLHASIFGILKIKGGISQ